MKIWYGFGSEHSMNLVMLGRFKDASSAKEAKDVLDAIAEQAREEKELSCDTREFSDEMQAILRRVKVYSLAPNELEQFLFDFRAEQKGCCVRIATDEIEISALLKILLIQGARVELFSADRYPEVDDNEA